MTMILSLIILVFMLLPSFGTSFVIKSNKCQGLMTASSWLNQKPTSAKETTTAINLDLKQEVIPPPNKRGPPQGGDMAYTQENIHRQMNTYESIRDVGGLECVRDVYARNAPQQECFFIGKLAFTSGTVTEEAAIHRQWNLLQEHASRLRPVELGRAFGRLEIYTAPGDSELAVSQNEVPLTRMTRPLVDDEADHPNRDISLMEIGFLSEVVTDRGVGFRVRRAPNGDLMSEP